MENTCGIKNCALAKKLKIKKEEECPNFVEAWWTPENKKDPVSIKDCAPKRTFIMIQNLHNRLIGVEKSQEQVRNNLEKDRGVITLLTQNIRMNYEKLIQEQERKALEASNDSLKLEVIDG